ncbi:Scramblase [bacterium BMS3Abin02]|nr:Scramblase [bacterium BMS3Abin02]GBE20751.1 Scramblase [bacterium BMS3Bbin01]HDH26799.1 DUF2510 domain-containing protein [Actinomycetota bacterium]
MTTLPAPDWYPDPAKRHQQRYWNGSAWTDQVADAGIQSVDPLKPGGPGDAVAERIQHQVEDQARITGLPAGGGTVFTEPVLVVNQKMKLIEVNNEYAIYDRNGKQIAAVRQVGQSTLKKILRVVSNLDQYMTHTLQVVDMAGNVLLTITRPRKIVKSRFEITDGSGNEIGTVSQKNVFGKIKFSLQAGGQNVGSIDAENWRAWNFSIKDASGVEVARITKTWEGLLKTAFTTADNYVVQIEHVLTEPLRSLVIASALTVDTALKQDSRGLN